MYNGSEPQQFPRIVLFEWQKVIMQGHFDFGTIQVSTKTFLVKNVAHSYLAQFGQSIIVSQIRLIKTLTSIYSAHTIGVIIHKIIGHINLLKATENG